MIVGSFLNVCVHRLPRGESIVYPPSHCPECNKAIPWYDNVPVASFFFLRGRCRFCKARIRPRYLIVELLTGLLFVLLYLSFGLSVKFVAGLIFVALLIVATFVDFEHEEIPDEVSLGGLVLGVILAAAFPHLMRTGSRGEALLRSIVGAAAGWGCVFVMAQFGKALFKKKLEKLSETEAVGSGDGRLMAMIGAFLGWKLALLTFFIAPFFGSIVGITVKLRHGREIIPYGPYLSLGALIAFLFGDEIVKIFFFMYL